MWIVCNRLSPFQRAIKAGGDSRFDEVKHQTGTFTAFWMAQGLSADPCLPACAHSLAASWVFLIGLPVYLVRSAFLVRHQR